MYQNIDDLIYIKFLGSGSYGQVDLYKKINSDEFFAVKKINKLKAKNSNYFKYLPSELNALKKLNHDNIAKPTKIKEDEFNILLVMEYCHGYSLFDCLKYYKEKYKKPFTEEIVQYLTKQIVETLIYIHDNNIIHRDLKLENIMVHFINDMDKINLNMMKAKIKIIDFGLSKVLSSSNKFATSVVGTYLYMDPKIIEKNLDINNDIKNFQYSKEADIWSLGCLCCEMLKGEKVFTNNQAELLDKIKIGKYKLPQTVSREFISFLYGMLQYDGKLRLTARQLLDKSFLRKNIKEFHYLSVDHDLKQAEEFLALKSSIIAYNKKMNKSDLKTYKKHISSEQINQNKGNNMTNNSNQDSTHFSSSFNINNGYSYYGQSMFPENYSINSSQSNNIPIPHSMNLPNHQNIDQNIINNNNHQLSTNVDMEPPLQRYNSEHIDKQKDGLCIVF